MKKGRKNWIIGVAIISILILVYFIFFNNFIYERENNPFVGGKDEHGCVPTAGYVWNESYKECFRGWEMKYCSEQSRNSEVCVQDYTPVCGYYTLENCEGLNCKKTFSNSCSACADEKVLFYINGEC